ncbi:hypothetical protein BKP35_05400 [Anaerobacillus arseniciselenatis]|uniref:Uncharacterized protein n=1 Tax=Anaerobacillus arseniciselenatis TaxID=85682 RepID=A0A1S2LT22_9BACI|nr:hypothetical protein [Anaerobacillus arseniciselenatis]OIJ15283.1 hypothetical protein BKP35_05400 [Anaerobacillus arseniciselenatis]
MIYSNFTCTKYIAVQSGTSNEAKAGFLGHATPTELCRFINGEIYHATAILGQIRTGMDDFKEEMKRWQQILFQCGGDLYITNDFNVTGKEVTFLKEWLSRLEPKNFVLQLFVIRFALGWLVIFLGLMENIFFDTYICFDLAK